MNSKMHEHICLASFSKGRKRGESCPNYQQAMKFNSKTSITLKSIITEHYLNKLFIK